MKGDLKVQIVSSKKKDYWKRSSVFKDCESINFY